MTLHELLLEFDANAPAGAAGTFAGSLTQADVDELLEWEETPT